MESYNVEQQELLNLMHQHVAVKSCCCTHEEFVDMNPVEPGLAYSDGYFVYSSNCPEAKHLNARMKCLMKKIKESSRRNSDSSNFSSDDANSL